MIDPVSLIAGPIVKVVADLATEFIKEQHHLVYGVKDEVLKLESSLSAIQASLADVDGVMSNNISPRLQDWLIKLKDAALDVQDVLEIYPTKASKMSQKKRRLVAKPFLRREAALNIKKIAKRINIISEERQFNLRMPKTQNRVFKPYGLQQTGSSQDSSCIFGREEEKEKIIEWILSENSDIEGEVSVCSVTGMSGLGKTTLAQLVYNDGRLSTHFDHRIWIDVTGQFNLEKIGKELIESITEKKHVLTTWSSIVKRIEEVLYGKCFLLILDDLWYKDFMEWDKLRQLLKKGRRGSRVVITSQISRTVGAHHSHLLDFLPEEACWSLFANKALIGGQGQRSSGRIAEIGRQIVQKCHRLPLAVAAMAILLRGCTDVSKWERVLREGIWGTELMNDANGETNILPALRFSYDHLPSRLKQCFTYCCLFPKDHTFDRSDLVKLWMAEGFIDSSGHSLPEETGYDYFEELKSRSFFHQVKVDDREGYTIHAFFHDLATLISGQSCHVVQDVNFAASGRCRHLSILSKDVKKPASEVLKVTKIRTFLLPTMQNTEIGQALDKMFNTLEYLRVLDLSSSTLIELPSSIGKLLLLRYLDLSRTEIRKLPSSVCKLTKLQTLKLLGCLWLSKLPNDLGNLSNLRHLELDDMFWYNCSSLPPKIGSLIDLQNLHSFPVVCASGCGLEQLHNLKNLTGKLCISKLENAIVAADANLREKDYLEELVLEWSEGITRRQDPAVEERIIEKLDPHSNIKGIQICRYKGFQLPEWMADLTLRNLSKVSLSYCVNVKSLSSSLLCRATELYIKGMLELEEWKDSKNQNLKRLQISKCPKLKSLPSSFQKLMIMKIKSCDMLRNLPMAPSLKSLILVDNILLQTGLEEEFSAIKTGNTFAESAGEVFFTVVKIVNCPKFIGLRPTFQTHRLEISNCPMLKSLPIPKHSQQLEHVGLNRCTDPTLVEAIPSSSSVQSLVLSNIANLLSLPVSLQLPGLKALYIHECHDFTSLSYVHGPLLNFTSLKLLSVCDCPKLEVLANFGLPTSLEYLSIKKCKNLETLGLRKCLKALVALKDFYLEDCPKLGSFPEDGLPSSLKQLSILRCHLLSQRFNTEVSYTQMIAHITELQIDET